MKHIKTLIALGVLGLLLGGLAIAQVHHGRAWSHLALHHPADSAAMVEHLSKAYPMIATFDANKDGQLDQEERAALAKAIADGTLQLPMQAAPGGQGPSAEELASHIGQMYARVAAYDANHNGTLDENELATIKSAIEKGELVCPHGP